jgi:hypothetical protein
MAGIARLNRVDPPGPHEYTARDAELQPVIMDT